MTQVDKFAPRKYLSSLKLVFASDTRFTHFVLFFYSAQDFCHRTLNKSGLCLSHYDLNKTKQDSEIWNNFIEDHLTVGIPDICHEPHEHVRVNFFWPV